MGFKMTDILPPAGWPNVRQLETNEFATGGANGNMNEQAKSLAARSELLKQYAALPYESKTGGYALNERVQLATGDIVRSTIASNVNNPNENMTGWVKTNSASQIFDASGLSQQEINDLQDIKNAETVSIDDYLRKYGVSPTDDISSVLNQIKSDGVKKLHVKSREYIVNSLIEFTADFEFDNEVGTVFNFGNTGGFYAKGSIEQVGVLTSDITKRQSYSFTISSTTGLKVGDWLALVSDTDYSFSPYRDYYRKGEYIEIASISGSNITFFGRAYDDYLASENIKIYKINPIDFKWNLLNTKSTDTNPNAGLKLEFSRGFTASNFKNEGGMYYGLYFNKCFNFNIMLNSATNSSPVNTTNYGMILGSCQGFSSFGAKNSATRHGFALGSGDGIGIVPTRDGQVYGATLFASDVNTSGADIHGNCEFITYDNCITNYATFSGSNNTYMNCDIYERDLQGCVNLSEPRGGVMNLINNRYYTKTGLSTYAVIHSNIAQQLREDLILNVIGGEVFGVGGANAQIVSLRQSASLNENLTKSISVKISGGVTSHLDQQAIWCRVEDAAAVRVMPIGYLIVDNVVNSKDSAIPYLVHPSTSTLAAGVKTRQMRQSGSVQMSSAAGTTVTRAPVVNLRYKYHKEPSVIASIGNYLGQAAWDQTAFDDGTTQPQRTPAATNCFVTVSQVRPMVFWNKTVATAKTFNFSWSCEVNDI